MSRKVIEVVQVLIDRIHQGGYTQRVLEDDIYAESQKRIAAEKDRDHWRQARDTAIEGGELLLESNQTLQAENETLRKQLADAEHPPAMAQQRDEIAYLRARLDEERSVSAGVRQQLDAARANVESLQQRLTEAQQERVDAIDDYEGQIAAAEALIDPEANGETTIAGMADMILHLREQLADAQLAVSDAFAEVNSVRQQLDAANAAVTLQRAGIDRLQEFVEKVREVRAGAISNQWHASWNEITAALAELDAGTEPTPVAEPLDAEGGA